MLRGTEMHPTASALLKLHAALGEQVVGEMAAILTQRLKSPRTGLTEATEAISALLQLQADGAQCAQNLDPVNLFIATLVCPMFHVCSIYAHLYTWHCTGELEPAVPASVVSLVQTAIKLHSSKDLA